MFKTKEIFSIRKFKNGKTEGAKIGALMALAAAAVVTASPVSANEVQTASPEVSQKAEELIRVTKKQGSAVTEADILKVLEAKFENKEFSLKALTELPDGKDLGSFVVEVELTHKDETKEVLKVEVLVYTTSKGKSVSLDTVTPVTEKTPVAEESDTPPPVRDPEIGNSLKYDLIDDGKDHDVIDVKDKDKKVEKVEASQPAIIEISETTTLKPTEAPVVTTESTTKAPVETTKPTETTTQTTEKTTETTKSESTTTEKQTETTKYDLVDESTTETVSEETTTAAPEVSTETTVSQEPTQVSTEQTVTDTVTHEAKETPETGASSIALAGLLLSSVSIPGLALFKKKDN